MAVLYRRWDEPRSLFGDLMFVGFVLQRRILTLGGQWCMSMVG